MHKFLSAIFVYLFLSLTVHADAIDDCEAAFEAKEYEEAHEICKTLAIAGDAEAQFIVGVMYEYGHGGVPQNHNQAFKWYRLAAEQGSVKAQFTLGYKYNKGIGVLEDDEEAVKWYRLAAEQGFDSAQYNLGLMYRRGEAIPKDDVIAYMWLNLSAAQGNDTAQAFRDSIKMFMTSSQIAEAQKLSRECLKKEYKNCY